MTKYKLILGFLAFSLMIFLALSNNFKKSSLDKYHASPQLASQIVQDYQTDFVKSYKSKASEPSLDSLQCPVPYKDRVKNYTGIQCVYSSIEMLGRWAGESKLSNPPITSRDDCKGYSSPDKVKETLNKLKVKFEQAYGNKQKGLDLIKKAMKEGRGVLWSVPGHAMVLIHYSEEENRVCWVDNSDRQLRIQETTIDKFNQRWTSWVLVIYPDSDNILLNRLGRNIQLPVIDHQNKDNKLNNFIPFPN
jgi:hypothetical protein